MVSKKPNNPEIYLLIPLETRSPKSSYLQDHTTPASQKLSSKRTLSCLFQLLAALGIPWLVATQLHSLPPFGYLSPSIVAHTYNPSSHEVEAGGLQI
jgi:hypothetical protein